ncbi:hypothetical protein [Streptomyces sp. NRRL S-87]|uniref:hypothetical protein n=1 Tax=Streptomyces sp. NRRL S-87 TaxID=1463920 RepID=UPI0004C112F1|nr:hypothetical protein [Streptomyces sp. NRRL S-87]
MRPLNRRAAAAVLLSAALTLTACSSGGDTTEAEPKPPASSSAPEPTLDPTTAPPAAKPTGPVISDDALKPATGSFTKQEKKYLSGRVPEKTDPAAVLQTGQEACQRVARTAKHDKDAAVAALVAGEIPNAEEAIPYLCPEQKPILAAAENGFGDGTLKNPTPGTYRAPSPTPSCVWQAKGRGGKSLAAGPDLGFKAGDKVTAKIPAGTVEFVSTGCYAWIPA